MARRDRPERAVSDAGLRAAAEAATPGPWEAVQGATEGWWVEVSNTATIADIDCDYSGHPEADAQHIAAFDPPTALGLLDRLEAAEAKVARVEAMIRDAKRVSTEWPGEWWNPADVADDLRAALDAAGHGDPPGARSGLTGRCGGEA